MQPRSDPQGPVVRGRAFPPGHSLETLASLAREDGCIVLRDDAGQVLRRLEPGDLRVQPPIGSLERRVELPDGAVFLTHDAADLDDLLGPPPGDVLHLSERLHPRLVGVVAAALLGLAGIWAYGIPILVAIAVWLTPPPLLSQMDAGFLSLHARLGATESDLPPDRRAAIQAVFDDLTAVAPPPPRGTRYDLVLADSPLGMNALALPGGTVLLTDGLARRIGADDDALAGVLAHEITHVEAQHGLHALYQSLTLYVVIAMLAGDTGPILEDILLEGNALLSLAGSREAEYEADAGAVALTRAAGYDPMGLVRLFEIFGDEIGEGGGYASSHPGTSERIEAVREAIGR